MAEKSPAVYYALLGQPINQSITGGLEYADRVTRVRRAAGSSAESAVFSEVVTDCDGHTSRPLPLRRR